MLVRKNKYKFFFGTPDLIGRLILPAGKRLPVGAGNDGFVTPDLIGRLTQAGNDVKCSPSILFFLAAHSLDEGLGAADAGADGVQFEARGLGDLLVGHSLD